MSTKVLSANESLIGYHGGKTIYKFLSTDLAITEGVREITNKSQSYWFLDIIASYQPRVKNEDFQLWKLERDYRFTLENGIKTVTKRNDNFTVTCEDGNENILLIQKIHFSDFPFDEFVVWLENEIIYLPCEH